MSGFSFRGVYNAPIGTTSREASYRYCQLPNSLGFGYTYHSGARKDIPTKSYSIPVLYFAPLLLQSLMIHI